MFSVWAAANENDTTTKTRSTTTSVNRDEGYSESHLLLMEVSCLVLRGSCDTTGADFWCFQGRREIYTIRDAPGIRESSDGSKETIRIRHVFRRGGWPLGIAP